MHISVGVKTHTHKQFALNAFVPRM